MSIAYIWEGYVIHVIARAPRARMFVTSRVPFRPTQRSQKRATPLLTNNNLLGLYILDVKITQDNLLLVLNLVGLKYAYDAYDSGYIGDYQVCVYQKQGISKLHAVTLLTCANLQMDDFYINFLETLYCRTASCFLNVWPSRFPQIR
jgi:hypothetical protein